MSRHDLPEDRNFMTQRELADRWRLSGRTLERWRADRFGPSWTVLGGNIRYRVDDIRAFEVHHRRGAHLVRKTEGESP